MKKLWLFITPFLTFFIISLIDIIQRPRISFNSFILWLIVSVVLGLIVFGIVYLVISGLSKINPSKDKLIKDGLIGGIISFLIAAFVFYAIPYLNFLYLVLGIRILRPYSPRLLVLLPTLIFSLPTVLVASRITKNKWKGIIVGCSVYFLMSLAYLIMRVIQHGP